METTNILKPKVSIIGCGNVGLRYAYALMIRGVARQIVLVDINTKRLEGDVLDLSHGAPYLLPVDIVAGAYEDIKNSDLVVVTVGKKQKPGQNRFDLTKENVALYKDVIPRIVAQAPEALLLIVSNPVDVLSYAAYKISGKPAHTVIGSGTVLDTARFRWLLSKHCELDARNVHAYILGEHGDSEFPVWSSAIVGGVLFKDYCMKCKKENCGERNNILERIFTEVRDSAYKIIDLKGETSYGIGLALIRISRALLNDENSVLPVSSYINGFFGIRDVYLSLPAVLNKGGVRELLPITFDNKEKELLEKSANIIKKVIKELAL